MEHRPASFRQSGPAADPGQYQEARQNWQGPRFEIIDEGATTTGLCGVRRVLSALTLVMLVVVGGVGFFHKVLPQIIAIELAKQAPKAKKPVAKEEQNVAAAPNPPDPAAPPNAVAPADEARAEDQPRARREDEDALNAAQDRRIQEELRKFEEHRAEQERRRQEFIERRPRRHDRAFGGFPNFPGGFDHVVPRRPDSFRKDDIPIQSLPNARIKNLRG